MNKHETLRLSKSQANGLIDYAAPVGAPEKIQLVARHAETNREIHRQQFEAHETDRASAIMIARNRADAPFIVWGIETESLPAISTP